MKIAIVGSRSFNDYDLFVGELNKIFSEEDFEIDEIVSGEALGTDLMAKKLALNNNIKYIGFPADWNKFGKSAGFIRNQQIVDNSDIIIAFQLNKSKGTQDTINKAKLQNKKVILIKVEELYFKK